MHKKLLAAIILAALAGCDADPQVYQNEDDIQDIQNRLDEMKSEHNHQDSRIDQLESELNFIRFQK